MLILIDKYLILYICLYLFIVYLFTVKLLVLEKLQEYKNLKKVHDKLKKVVHGGELLKYYAE